MSSASRPNVLLITTDQQAALAVGAAGNPDLSTPAMDALGERGVRFERAYCTFPLCTPSRASLYTGRMPHEVGADYNNKPIAPEFRSGELGNLMAAGGYDCGYGGKWHVPEIEIGEGHGFRKICGFDDWALADRCIDFLRTPRSAPFFLVASFDNPHNICEHSRRQRLPWGAVPHAPVGECPNLPANFEVPAYEPSLIKHERALKPAAELTEDEWRTYRHTYYRLVEKVDADVARIMAALEETGHSGGHPGDLHQRPRRRHGRPSLEPEVGALRRVDPHTAHRPGRPPAARHGWTTDHLVSNGLDLLPTICDYAGVQPPADLRGRSLRPLIDGGAGAGGAGVAGSRRRGDLFRPGCRGRAAGADGPHGALQVLPVRQRQEPRAALRPGAGPGRDGQPGRRSAPRRRARRATARCSRHGSSRPATAPA